MKYANEMGYSDVEPHEVIREVSAKCLEIRAMSAALDPTWKPDMIPGGFSAHTVNNGEQRWLIRSSEASPVIRIRLGKRGWKDKHGNRYVLSDKPRKFYDYNF
jgi:hypothetical protein